MLLKVTGEMRTMTKDIAELGHLIEDALAHGDIATAQHLAHEQQRLVTDEWFVAELAATAPQH